MSTYRKLNLQTQIKAIKNKLNTKYHEMSHIYKYNSINLILVTL